MSEDRPVEDTVTLVLQDGRTLSCDATRLKKKSRYFAALLASGMSESRPRTIQLDHLDTRAVLCFVEFLETNEISLWQGFNWQGDDGAGLEQTFDYLQFYDNEKGTEESTLQAIQILHNPASIEEECISQGWIHETTGSIQSLPEGKKKRAWRFWVCYCLCLAILPETNNRIDQLEFTEKLSQVKGAGGPVALRRELVEYDLIEREGDGSAYWRPNYTVAMMRRWLKGMPRRVI